MFTRDQNEDWVQDKSMKSASSQKAIMVIDVTTLNNPLYKELILICDGWSTASIGLSLMMIDDGDTDEYNENCIILSHKLTYY